MQRTLITGAQIVTDQNVFYGAVLIEGERISAVYPAPDAPPKVDAAEHIDAGGGYLLPGGVDAHTHFDLDCGSARASDDFYTGSVAAAFGGTTTVIDHMAFGPKGCRLGHQSEVYRRLARRCAIDYGFHGVIQHVNGGILAEMKDLKEREGLQSFKIYLTYDHKLNDEDILAVLRRAKELGIVICAHCENDAVVTGLRRQFISQGNTAARFHPLSRPAEAEAEAVWRAAMLARAAGGAGMYIVHLSTKTALNALRLARKSGQKRLFAESCPQYLLLDSSRYNDDFEGLKYIMSPPLRERQDINALWAGLADGSIETVGTDHCPFFFATQKQAGINNFTLCPNGAPGVELRMPLLFSEGFLRGRLTLPQVVMACCSRPARIFGLWPKKGCIAPGADADLVLFSAKGRKKITKAMLHENTDYTPYEGLPLSGGILWTMLRGQIIVTGGSFTGCAGAGKYQKRHAPDID